MSDRSRTPDRPLAFPLESRRRKPTFEGCGSWPECDCRNHCEVRRLLGIHEPTFSWPEIALLVAVALGGAVSLYFGWPTK